VSAHTTGDLTVWDLAAGKELFHMSSDSPRTLTSHPTSMARVPGTDTVLTATQFNTIRNGISRPGEWRIILSTRTSRTTRGAAWAI
jgi:hypothetical protein